MKAWDWFILVVAAYFGIAGYSHGLLNALTCATIPLIFYFAGTLR
jgi:uncharacterized membrane protein required for colicin V production